MKDARTPSERLTLARVAAGYADPASFYKRFGIPQGTYGNHEAGHRGIRRDKAEEYARLLGNCTAAWILYGEGGGPSGTIPGTASLPKAEADAIKRRHEEAASFLLLYDRIGAITEENEQSTAAEFGLVFRNFGYDAGPRGLVQLAFRLWQDIVAEDNALSFTERALQKIAWVEATLNQMVNIMRQIPRAPDADK